MLICIIKAAVQKPQNLNNYDRSVFIRFYPVSSQTINIYISSEERFPSVRL